MKLFCEWDRKKQIPFYPHNDICHEWTLLGQCRHSRKKNFLAFVCNFRNEKLKNKIIQNILNSQGKMSHLIENECGGFDVFTLG